MNEEVAELLRAVESGDAATAWERARSVAQAVLSGEAVRLAKAVLAGGPLALHEAVKLAAMVGVGDREVGEDESEGEDGSTTTDIVRWTLRHTRATVRVEERYAPTMAPQPLLTVGALASMSSRLTSEDGPVIGGERIAGGGRRLGGRVAQA